MKYLIPVILIVATGCSTVRTRTTDPVMRVAIDAESMSEAAYPRLQKALFMSGKFIVVDRAAGFRAVAKEQERQHTTTRFGEQEKYALWSKLFGVGGIFVGSEQCKKATNMWGGQYFSCVQTLSLINATTGEVMAMAEANEDSDGYIEPAWDTAVTALLEKYPRVFIDKNDPNRTIDYDKNLLKYREQTVVQNRKASVGMSPEDYLR